MFDLIRIVNVEKSSWNEHNGLPTFPPFYPFFESLRPFWTLKKLSDPNENLHSCLYLEKEHFPHRVDINFQRSPFSTYPSSHREEIVKIHPRWVLKLASIFYLLIPLFIILTLSKKVFIFTVFHNRFENVNTLVVNTKISGKTFIPFFPVYKSQKNTWWKQMKSVVCGTSVG